MTPQLAKAGPLLLSLPALLHACIHINPTTTEMLKCHSGTVLK